MALVIADAMNYHAADVVIFGARSAEVQVSVHSSTPKDPETRGKTNKPESSLVFP